MQANRRRDTKPELAVRRRLHAAGLRYRVDAAPISGLNRRADVVFTKQKVAVFIDGCFWHGCPGHGSHKFGMNAEYWSRKIEANQARDVDTNRRLITAGWTVLRYWEHADPADVAATIIEVLDACRARNSKG